MRRTSSAADDLERVRQAALGAIRGIARPEAVDIACRLCDREAAWVRRAWREGVLEAVCCGRFDLVNPSRPDLPWPALVFAVRGRAEHEQAVVSLYWAPEGAWRVSVDGPVEQADGERRCSVAWEQFVGGPGLLGGDPPEGVQGELFRPSSSGPAAAPGPGGTPAGPSAGPAAAAGPVRSTRRPARRAGGRGRGRGPAATPAASPAGSSGGTAGSPPGLTPQQELLLRLLRLLGG